MDKKRHIMVDIETVGSKGIDGSIVSIGAVAFDETAMYETFYIIVDWHSAIFKYKRTKDDSTMQWWKDQPPEARGVLSDFLRVDLKEAMVRFTQFVEDSGGRDPRVWGYGSTFDNMILRSSYDAVGLTCPWSFRNDMCFRTLKHLVRADVHIEREGIHHHALDDAVHQARQAQVLLRKLALGEKLVLLKATTEGV